MWIRDVAGTKLLVRPPTFKNLSVSLSVVAWKSSTRQRLVRRLERANRGNKVTPRASINCGRRGVHGVTPCLVSLTDYFDSTTHSCEMRHPELDAE
jgi:hypothetical protein